MSDQTPVPQSSSGTTRRSVLKTLGVASAVGATGISASMAASSTPANDTAPTLKWLRRYPEWNGDNYGHLLHSLIPLDDGGYVAGTPQLALQKVDDNGDQVWTQQIDRDHDAVRDLVRMANGRYAMVGIDTINDDPAGGSVDRYSSYVICTNQTGDVQWEREYGYDDDSDVDVTFVSALGTPDGGVLVAGGRENPPDDQSDEYQDDPLLVKFTADGDEEWTQVGTLAHEDDKITEATLDVTADDQYLLLTLEGLYVLNSGGETVWDRPMEGWNIHDAIATDDGGTAWIATERLENENGASSYEGADSIVKTDAEGTIQWHQTYENIPGSGRQIVERESGFAVAGQTAVGSSDDSDFLLLGAGPEGNYQWHTVFGTDANNERVREGDLVVRDGDYVIGGTSDPHNDNPDAATIAKCAKSGDDDSGTMTDTEPPTVTTTATETTTAIETQTDSQTDTPTPAEGTETDKDC